MMGGKRPGAGRKKGYKAIAAEKAREVLVQEVTKQWIPLVEAQMALALGHCVATVDEKGRPVIAYSVPPDPAAIKYLIDQTIGKPKESHEVGGKDGEAILLKWQQ